MAIHPSIREDQDLQAPSHESRAQVPDREAIMPIVEGARARGVADAFEMVGQGALLLDATGTVLHAGMAAQRMMGADLSIQSGHLVAQTGPANQAIEQLLSGLLDQGTSGESVLVARKAGGKALRIRGFAFNPDQRSPYQLLAAVLLIEESAD